MSEPKYRRPLNDQQIELLKLLYKFRFASSDLVANYYGKNHRMFAFNRLKILEEQGLIAKRFDPSYKLQGKPAAYYLLPAGARSLQENRKLDVNIKSIYKNKDLSDDFVQYCLEVFSLRNDLKNRYREALKFFTKNDLVAYDYFPTPLPTAYIRLKTNDGENRYFLELPPKDMSLFAAVRRVRQYIAYAEEGIWEDTGQDFPIIIFLCDNEAFQKRLEKRADSLIKDSGLDELKTVIAIRGNILGLMF